MDNTGRCAIDVELSTTIPEPSTLSCRAILKTCQRISIESVDIWCCKTIQKEPVLLCFNFNNYIQFSQITRSENCCCINLFCPTWLYHALCCLPWCDGSRTDINELKYQQRIVCSNALSPKIYIISTYWYSDATRVRNVETHLFPSQTFSWRLQVPIICGEVWWVYHCKKMSDTKIVRILHVISIAWDSLSLSVCSSYPDELVYNDPLSPEIRYDKW